MKYGSVCSGVEAATMAWHHMGWKPSFFSEIEQFPCAVLQHHYPEVPLHGDFTTIGENDYEPIDLLVGGTPCQSFSIAGLRKGMADDRGNLALEFLKLAQRTRPTWVVWENVPGVLSSNGGRDFGAFLGGLGEIGYGFAYRVLNAQYFGVPQRRRRVFVVGYFGDWRPPAQVLFERYSLSGHPAPSREAGEGFAERVIGCLAESSGNARPGDNIQSVDYLHPYETARCITTGKGQRRDAETKTMICFEPRSPDGVPRISKDVCPTLNTMGGGQREPCVAFGWQNSSSQGDSVSETVSPTLDKSKTPAVAFSLQGGGKTSQNSQGSGWNKEVCFTTNCMDVHGVAYEIDEECNNNMQVRRLTPVECERLQGFPDDFTKIPYRNKTAENCPDGPRYKAMGNSMAVPVMKWIGERIEKINGNK
jgi:DNA (cytosine-5)-methyltransferase 1